MNVQSYNVLEVNNLSKRFREKCVIKNASFNIKKNSIVGLIGKNGAGKTTLMRMLIGFLTPDTGSVKIYDNKVKLNGNNLKIGYLTDVPIFYEYMTAYEYLAMCAGLKKIEKEEVNSEVNKFLKLVNLEDNKNKRIKGYSRGMKQRLGIAQCLLGRPSLIICDEPMSALDPVGREEVINIFNKIKNETSVLLSTHILSDIERLCDEVIIINNGKIKHVKSLKELESLSGNSKLMEISFVGQKDKIINKFESFLLSDNIKYKKASKKFLVSELSDLVIKRIYGYFGNSTDVSIFPNSIKMLDISADEIF